MLREAKGAPQDIIEAAHWLKRAADGGIIAGQVEYAIMLFNGEGVRKMKRARPRSSYAAARGNPIAQTESLISMSAAERCRATSPRPRRGTASPKRRDWDPELDVATADLTLDERRRFTKLVHELGGFDTARLAAGSSP